MVLVGPPRTDRSRTGTNQQSRRPNGWPWRWHELRRWGARRVGVVAVIVVYGALGTINALTVPPLVPRDEPGHISYVVSITHGHLPTVDTPLPLHEFPSMRLDQRSRTLANHPPLFYVLAAGPMRLALAVHRPLQGIRLIRLMNVGLVMLTMGLAAVLARRLVGRSVRAPIVAAAVTGLIATVPHTAAMAYNDALAMFTAAALMVAAVAVFDRGPSRGRLAWVAAAASAAALTRFTSFAVIAPAGAVVAAGVWRNTDGGVAARVGRVLRAGLIVVVPIAASSGWFYLRNHRLYGDYTGAQKMFAVFGREKRGASRSYVASPGFWRGVHDDLWTGYSRTKGPQYYGHGWPISVGRGLSLVLLLGLRCAVVRWLWIRATRERSWRWTPNATVALIAVGAMAIFAVMMAKFEADGGVAHSRYLFPLLPAVGCFVALAWACLPGNRHGGWSVGALLASVGVAGLLLHRTLAIQTSDDGLFGTERALLGRAVPAPSALLTILLAVLGTAVAMTCWALLTLPPEQLLRATPSQPDAAEARRTGVRPSTGQGR